MNFFNLWALWEWPAKGPTLYTEKAWVLAHLRLLSKQASKSEHWREGRGGRAWESKGFLVFEDQGVLCKEFALETPGPSPRDVCNQACS